MDTNEEILNNERYREIIDQFDDETLELVANDHLKALKAARKGIEQEEPERIDEVEYLEALATGMQELAKRILEERAD